VCGARSVRTGRAKLQRRASFCLNSELCWGGHLHSREPALQERASVNKWNAGARYLLYLQFTFSVIRLLTAGGTSLEAMHKYAPICRRSNLTNCRVSPLKVSTVQTEIIRRTVFNIPICAKEC